MDARTFRPDVIFSYNYRRKVWSIVILFCIALFSLLLVAYYVLYLKHTGFFVVDLINSVVGHVYGQVRSGTLLGASYVSLIGGLFFVALPVELLYLTFLRNDHNGLLLMGIYIGGFLISYTLNYHVGLRLSRWARKLISSRKFYKFKSLINRYGVWAVFTFNVLPLPSQPLAMILGVFRYNQQRFYLFFLLGQTIKYAVITGGYFYIVM